MAILVQDSFDRANSTSVIGDPAIGPSPTVLTGTMGITGNQLYSSALTSTRGAVVWDVGTVNVELEATVLMGTSALATGFIVGAESISDSYLLGFAYLSSEQTTSLGLSRMAVGNTVPHMIHKKAIYQAASAPGYSTPTVLKVVVHGGMYSMFTDGVEVGRPSKLPWPWANTRAGIVVSSTASRIDNLTIQDSSALTIDSHSGHLYKGRPTMSSDAGAIS